MLRQPNQILFKKHRSRTIQETQILKKIAETLCKIAFSRPRSGPKKMPFFPKTFYVYS